MSRSRRHTTICSITTSDSEKDDKRIWHRRFRHRNKQRVSQGQEPLTVHEVSDPYTMNKDGKMLFDPQRHPDLMRK